MEKLIVEKRMVVKIMAGPMRQDTRAIYYRDGLTIDFVFRWDWYFKYREALYRVQNPRHFVELRKVAYDYIPPLAEEKKRLQAKISAARGQLSKWENIRAKFEREWNQLFPFQEDEGYKKAIEKINAKKTELGLLLKQQNDLNA